MKGQAVRMGITARAGLVAGCLVMIGCTWDDPASSPASNTGTTTPADAAVKASVALDLDGDGRYDRLEVGRGGFTATLDAQRGDEVLSWRPTDPSAVLSGLALPRDGVTILDLDSDGRDELLVQETLNKCCSYELVLLHEGRLVSARVPEGVYLDASVPGPFTTSDLTCMTEGGRLVLSQSGSSVRPLDAAKGEPVSPDLLPEEPSRRVRDWSQVVLVLDGASLRTLRRTDGSYRDDQPSPDDLPLANRLDCTPGHHMSE